jgi:hypothetical protein
MAAPPPWRPEDPLLQEFNDEAFNVEERATSILRQGATGTDTPLLQAGQHQ